jgi:hypothetical protein
VACRPQQDRNSTEPPDDVDVVGGDQRELKANRGVGKHVRRGFDDRADLYESLAYEIDADTRGQELACGHEPARPPPPRFYRVV